MSINRKSVYYVYSGRHEGSDCHKYRQEHGFSDWHLECYNVSVSHTPAGRLLHSNTQHEPQQRESVSS